MKIILERKFFTMESLLSGLEAYFLKQNKRFRIIAKGSSPTISVDDTYYKVFIGNGDAVFLGCKEVLLKKA